MYNINPVIQCCLACDVSYSNASYSLGILYKHAFSVIQFISLFFMVYPVSMSIPDQNVITRYVLAGRQLLLCRRLAGFNLVCPSPSSHGGRLRGLFGY